jgi:hypothetical protein
MLPLVETEWIEQHLPSRKQLITQWNFNLNNAFSLKCFNLKAKRINSLYAKLGYKDFLYLDITAEMTVVKCTSDSVFCKWYFFFYPSVSSSFTFLM